LDVPEHCDHVVAERRQPADDGAPTWPVAPVTRIIMPFHVPA
jgi:hypothetical protein